MSAADARVDAWLDALVNRHTSAFTTSEFLKAVRALSARYVESRQELSNRSPIDSAGKRAAFAAFYAPLHFFTARLVLRALDAPLRAGGAIIDLGCGTGVVGAALAVESSAPCTVLGVDQNAWALGEAQWNWNTLGVSARSKRGNLEAPVKTFVAKNASRGRGQLSTLVFGWSINELSKARIDSLLAEVVDASGAGVATLILEPLARSATPWWNQWAARVIAAGGRADEWKFDVALPPRLAALDEAAGFRRESLGARSLWLPAAP